MNTIKETRCVKCNGLLFKISQGIASGTVEIKCQKCKYINKVKFHSSWDELESNFNKDFED